MIALPLDPTGALTTLVSKLDADQAAVARWRPSDGNLRVIACAGAGKTTTLTALAGVLVRDGLVRPDKLMLTTFTNKAAGEIGDRLQGVMPPAHFSRVRLGTFHALGLRVLRAAQPGKWEMSRNLDMGGRTRAPDVPQASMLWRSVVEFGEIPGLKRDSLKLSNDARAYSMAVQLFRAKCKDDPDKISAAEGRETGLEDFRLAWRTYNEAKVALRAWDFADVLSAWRDGLAAGTLPADVDVCMVDEAQDNDACQLQIAQLVARCRADGRLILIGDGSQTVHVWKGAYPELFLNADREIGAKTLTIGTNYRSGTLVVDLGNRVIEGHDWSLGNRARSHRGDVSSLHGEGFTDDMAEADWVAEQIHNEIESGAKPESFAILCRTNAGLGTFQAALTEMNVPCAVVGGTSIFEQREAVDVLAYLLLSQQDALPALEKILNRPKRYLPHAFMDQVRGYMAPGRGLPEAILMASMATKHGSRTGAGNLAQTLRDLRRAGWPAVIDVVEKLLTTKAEEEDEEAKGPPDDDRPGIYRAVANIARKFPNPYEYIAFADRCIAGTTKIHDDGGTVAGKVTLSTIHRAKGREWPNVYLSASEGALPHWRAVPGVTEDNASAWKGADLEAEVRLFYVGVTRARDTLTLTWSHQDRGRGRKMNGPSRFIRRWAPSVITSTHVGAGVMAPPGYVSNVK